MSGGWNCRDTEENIAVNELADVTNMTYADARGRLRLRRGTGAALHTFASNIDGMAWYNSKLCIVSGGKLWQWDDSGIGSMSEIGAVTGTARPSFQEFGGELYIATGAKLQKFDGTALSTIEDSYEDTIEHLHRIKLLACKLIKMLAQHSEVYDRDKDDYEDDEYEARGRMGRNRGRYGY